MFGSRDLPTRTVPEGHPKSRKFANFRLIVRRALDTGRSTASDEGLKLADCRLTQSAVPDPELPPPISS